MQYVSQRFTHGELWTTFGACLLARGVGQFDVQCLLSGLGCQRFRTVHGLVLGSLDLVPDLSIHHLQIRLVKIHGQQTLLEDRDGI